MALVLSYDGTDFAGWQRQDGIVARTVQGEVEETLSRLTGAPVAVHGASRTDSGVHALAQVAHADVEGPRSFPPHDLRHRLNGMLRDDVRVRAIATMGDDFHARRAATGKTYEYRLHVAPAQDPFTRRCSLHVQQPLDVLAMSEAARGFVGMRDFAALQSLGSSVKTSVREITRVEICGAVPDFRVVVDGTGFLRHMVRAMVGCLLEVGMGRHAPAWIGEVLASKDRSRAASNAPAQGLFLVEVRYAAPHSEALAMSLASEHAMKGPGRE